MPSMFNRAFASFAKSKIDRVFGIEADYLRGTECFCVTVLADQSLFQVDLPTGDVIKYRTFEFVIDQDAAPFKGLHREPQRKDRLEIRVNGVKRLFELLSDEGGQHFEEDDSFGLRFRLKAKEKPS